MKKSPPGLKRTAFSKRLHLEQYGVKIINLETIDGLMSLTQRISAGNVRAPAVFCYRSLPGIKAGNNNYKAVPPKD
jgi:hypothetical protein